MWLSILWNTAFKYILKNASVSGWKTNLAFSTVKFPKETEAHKSLRQAERLFPKAEETDEHLTACSVENSWLLWNTFGFTLNSTLCTTTNLPVFIVCDCPRGVMMYAKFDRPTADGFNTYHKGFFLYSHLQSQHDHSPRQSS